MTKVVSPLFELLEPVMCREEVGRPIGTLRAVLSIIQRGAYLAGGRLWVYRDKQDLLPESTDAKKISLLVSFEYDSLCQILGIPLRTIGYRRKTSKSYSSCERWVTSSKRGHTTPFASCAWALF